MRGVAPTWYQKAPGALLDALRHHRWLVAAAVALALALLFSHARGAAATAALAVPTLARSRSFAASDAEMVRDTFFAHTYSRAKPPRQATWAAFLASWRARLSALSMSSGMKKGLPQHAKLLTGEAMEWANFGEMLGDEWSIGHGGFTRCAQASFAVETYFCGSNASTAVNGEQSPYLYEPGVAALGEAVRRATELHANLIAEVRLWDSEDETFGHHFALRVAPGQGVRLYMSFIGQYKLGSYLTRHPAPLSQPQWEEALRQLQVLENASGAWSSAAEAAYHSLFDVRLGAKKDPKTRAGTISFSHAGVCVVPPWNGTAADPTAAGFAESVQELLPAPLQPFSLFGAPAGEGQWEEAAAGEEEPYF